MKALVFLSFTIVNFAQALVLEQTKAQVGERAISLIDIKNFQKQEASGLIPNSLLLDSLYKKLKSPSKEKNLFLLPELSKASHYQKLTGQNKALNYLIVREMLIQKLNQSEGNLIEVSKNSLTKTLNQKQAKRSSKRFLSRLKKVGFESLIEYQNFLREEEEIRLFLLRSLTPKATVSNREIESAFFKKYKRKLFSDSLYDFDFVSFQENKKESVLNALDNEAVIEDFEAWATSLDLSFKNSKLKSKEIGVPIRRALEDLSVSQVSPLLFINSSYYLLKLNWKEALIQPKDSKKKNQIEEKLLKEKLLKELGLWIQNEKDQTFLKLSSL